MHNPYNPTGAHYLSLALIAAFMLVIIAAAFYAAQVAASWQIPGTVCYEDMPCWNCETMGNLECGK